MNLPRRIAVCLLLIASSPAVASTVYKCESDQGVVSYQDAPCVGSTQKEEISYLDTYAEPPAAPPADDPAPPPTTPPPKPPPGAPAAAAESRGPDFYQCTRPDGTQYTSADGVATPYAVDGNVSVPAEYVYQPDTANRPQGAPTPKDYGSNTDNKVSVRYTFVQDKCRVMAPQDACAAIRAEHAAVQSRIKHAFSDTLPELKRRESLLAGKLDDC